MEPRRRKDDDEVPLSPGHPPSDPPISCFEPRTGVSERNMPQRTVGPESLENR